MSPALISAAFVERPNRFIVRAKPSRGAIVEAHLADPGRLVELLLPGAPLRLRPAPEASRRRTRYSVALVRAADTGVWVSLEAARANSLAETLLSSGRVRGVDRRGELGREVRCGRSRFDFLHTIENGRRLWIEVKSVTLVEGGVARFPDAPTDRGRRHVEELIERRAAGDGALVLFVAQRSDARSVVPHFVIDPAFAAALRAARQAGVLLRGARFGLDDEARATFLGALPVRLEPENELGTDGVVPDPPVRTLLA